MIAETELLQAAASIEEAARKLAELKPRERVVSNRSHTHTRPHTHTHYPHTQHADESLNFEEQILKAAKNIAKATSSLVRNASAAQRELVAQGRLSCEPKSEDSQWSEGLVSAVSDGRGTLLRAKILCVHGYCVQSAITELVSER